MFKFDLTLHHVCVFIYKYHLIININTHLQFDVYVVQ